MTASGKSERRLGRGLDALLASPIRRTESGDGASLADRETFRCALEKLVPQRGQPRKHFSEPSLDELAQSIRKHGLIEPIVVRRLGGADRFEIVAGERRWRAAQRAGLHEVMVVVKDFDDRQAYEVALIENVQREDLNPIEFAEALHELITRHGMDRDLLGEQVGKDRSTIANALRLLKLPAAVRKAVIAGELSEGHARALLGVRDDATLAELAERVIKGHLSVRETEALVRKSRGKAGSKAGASKSGEKSVGIRDLELRLSRRYGAPCSVRDRNGKGEISIAYASLDDLDRILETLL